MTQTPNRNEKIAQAVKKILATAEDHFDGGWVSHPTDDMTKVVSEVIESAVAEAVRNALEQIRCTVDIDGDVCDCCRMSYDAIDALITPQEGLQDSNN